MVQPANKRLVTEAALATTMASVVAIPPSTSDVTVALAVVLKPTTVTAARPALPTGMIGVWDWPGTSAPVNMGPNDLWAA